MSEQNPHRLAGSPALGEPALGLSPVAVVERSPTGLALLPQMVVRVATVIVGLAAVGAGVFPLFLPAPWAATGGAVCLAIVGLGATLGLASPGVRSSPGTQPVTLAAPAAPPSAPTPRIGPPPA